MLLKIKTLLSVSTFAALTTFSSGHGDHQHDHHHHHHHHHGALRALQSNGNGNGGNKWKDTDFCGTRQPDAAQQARDDEVVKKWKEKNKAKNGNRELQQARAVDVVIHLVHPEGNRNANDVIRNNNAQEQVDVLQAAYEGAFSFTLVSVLEWENSAWWGIGSNSAEERDMKSKTREGDCSTLNLWYTDLIGGLLGWATFPSWCANGLADDGCVNLHRSAIGGTASPYDKGDTATHEVGHWLGLYHTFQGEFVL